MKRLLLNIVIFVMLIILTSCPMDVEYPIYEISFRNNTNDSISIFHNWTSDTFMNFEDSLYSHVIASYESNIISYYENIRYEANKRNDSICIFVTNCMQIDNTTLKEISQKYDIECRYNLSVADLELLKYSIPYPPSPEMRTMHIYPSYDEILERYENKEN